MFTKKLFGWSALTLFILALAILGTLVFMVIFPSFAKIVSLDSQAMIWTSGVIALVAAGLGIYAYKTTPGKAGGIGGLVLSFVIAIMLLFTSMAARGANLSVQ